MSRSATLLRNGVHPRRLVELLRYDEPTGELVADWGKDIPDYMERTQSGMIDTTRPEDAVVREHSVVLDNGERFYFWFAYQAWGPRNTLLFTIKSPQQRPQVKEMDQRAAAIIGDAAMHIVRPRPTMIVVLPSRSWQAQHFAEELAKVTGLPLKTNAFVKRGQIKGTIAAQKQEWARQAYKLVDRESIEGASILLADDNVGTGASMAACAEQLYQNGAAHVLGVAPLSVSGGKKNRDIEDISLSFAKGFTAPDEPQESEFEPEESELSAPSKRNRRDVARTLRRALMETAPEDLRELTVKEICDIYEVKPVEVRFALAQLGLLGRVKPG